MIVYGYKASQIGKTTVSDNCPKCSSTSNIDVYLFQRYAHIFWIPLFPIGRQAVAQCYTCRQTLKKKEFPSTLQMALNNLKAESKTPLWMFGGLALALVIVVGIGFGKRQRHERNAKLIVAPLRGDIFEIKTEQDHFTLLKVEDVRGDSVWTRLHNYETDQRSGLDQLNRRDTAYSQLLYVLKKIDITKMFEDDEIIDIERE